MLDATFGGGYDLEAPESEVGTEVVFAVEVSFGIEVSCSCFILLLGLGAAAFVAVVDSIEGEAGKKRYRAVRKKRTTIAAFLGVKVDIVDG